MQSDVIIMAAFTRLFFKNIYTYDNVDMITGSQQRQRWEEGMNLEIKNTVDQSTLENMTM